MTNKFYKIISVVAACIFTNSYSVSLFANVNSKVVSSDSINFVYPVKGQIELSGNYGELRSNHFHGGVDFRVGGLVGAPIYATERGYISRVSVSGSGYGNALYITHPNGYVSVYGHLFNFYGKIEAYVREQQYKNEDFNLDLILPENMFVVQKGEQIANAGNTGSSGGPHLHFEIRDTANVPLDIYRKGYFKITDKTMPKITDVSFFAIKQGEVPATKLVKPIVPKGSNYTVLPPEFYVTIDAVDRIDGSVAKFAVAEYRVFLDTNLIYSFKLGDVSFAKGKYINSLIDYRQKVHGGKSVVKSYLEPGNGLSDRIYAKNNGVIVLNDDQVHELKIEVLDIYNNKNVKSYNVKRGNLNDFESVVKENSAKLKSDSVKLSFNNNAEQHIMNSNFSLEPKFMPWYISNAYGAKGLDLMIPAGALYSSIMFNIDTLPKRVSSFSPVWKIHNNDVPLHMAISVEMKCNVPDSLASKVLLAYVNRYGAISGAGGTYKDGIMSAKVSSFGNYTVAVDIVAPSVSCSIANGGTIKGNTITFKIRDNLSGIKKYRVEIDGKWVLGVWDSKTATVVVNLKEENISKGTHRIDIRVWDNKDNQTLVTRAFKW